MVQIVRGGIDMRNTFQSLLRVGDRPFNPKAPGNHHRLREQIAVAPTLQELWPRLKPWWTKHPLLAHNVGVEKNIVRKAAPLHQTGPWIDTLKLARHAYPDLPSHALHDLLESFELTSRVHSLCPGLEAHDAFYDAVGCAALFEYFLRLPSWKDCTLAALLSL